jgi:hypothetical protein
MVTTYRPAVVPEAVVPPDGVPELPPEPLPPLPPDPPHAEIPPPRKTSNALKPSIARQRRRRRRPGVNRSTRQTRGAPPAAYQEKVFAVFFTLLCDGAVVVIVRVAEPPTPLAMVTGLLEPKLNVGGNWLFGGAEVTEAESATLPVNP